MKPWRVMIFLFYGFTISIMIMLNLEEMNFRRFKWLEFF